MNQDKASCKISALAPGLPAGALRCHVLPTILILTTLPMSAALFPADASKTNSPLTSLESRVGLLASPRFSKVPRNQVVYYQLRLAALKHEQAKLTSDGGKEIQAGEQAKVEGTSLQPNFRN
ncbi:MAG: hypothetical protein IPQ13_10455 [Holophagaceae bacterium]|nr:hypothetical protein [Holophagaceae bacterium]